MIDKHSSQQHSVQKEFSSEIVETSEKESEDYGKGCYLPIFSDELRPRMPGPSLRLDSEDFLLLLLSAFFRRYLLLRYARALQYPMSARMPPRMSKIVKVRV